LRRDSPGRGLRSTTVRNGLQSLRPNPLLERAAAAYTTSLLVGRFLSHHGDFAGHPHSSTPVGRQRQIMYLLKPKFDQLGVAGAHGTPLDPNRPDGVTVAAEFGFRRVR
jgi:hypothetical protein